MSARKGKKKPPQDRSGPVPILKVKDGASLKAIYAAAQRAITAADLQKYTESEEGIPAQQILAELEAIDREESRKRGRNSKHGPSR